MAMCLTIKRLGRTYAPMRQTHMLWQHQGVAKTVRPIWTNLALKVLRNVNVSSKSSDIFVCWSLMVMPLWKNTTSYLWKQIMTGGNDSAIYWNYCWFNNIRGPSSYQLGASANPLHRSSRPLKLNSWITYRRPNSSAKLWFHDKVTTLDEIAWAQFALLPAVLINVSTRHESDETVKRQ